MIDKTTIIPTVLKRLKQIPKNHYPDLRTYKRNRSVIIVKKDEDCFLILENGFFQDEFEVSFSKLPGTLKTLLKKEFPRSRKIRLYAMGEYHPGKVENNSRKVI